MTYEIVVGQYMSAQIQGFVVLSMDILTSQEEPGIEPLTLWLV